MLKNNKGMSLTTTVMTVLIITIILSTLVYTAYTNLKIRKLNNLYTDIRTLSDEVAIYYLENNTLPVSGEFITLTVGEEIEDGLEFLTVDGTFTDQDSLFNPNDYDDSEGQAVYYILDLDLFDNITLEYTGDYIINEQSHTIYYYNGVTIDGTSYYALPLTYRDTEYNVKHPIDSVSVSTVYLPMGGTTLDLEDYITFTASDGSVAYPKSLVFTVSTSGYTSYFTIEDSKITSKEDVTATSSAFYITATATSYGDDTEITETLTIYLTDIEVFDSSADSEIEEINILKGETTTIYVQKFGKAGTLSMLAKVEEGDGIDATISSTVTTVNSKNVYPLTILGTNEGTVRLTILEENGNATRELTINVYDPEIDNTDIEFVSLDDTEEVTVIVGNNYNIEENNNYINWTSSDTSVVTVLGDGLNAQITSTGFGSAVIYCQIMVDDTELTTLEISITVTGVSIDDVTMSVGDEKIISYSIDSSISSSSISNVTWTSSDGTIVEVDTDEDTYYGILTANSSGTVTLQITVTLNSGQKYTDKCTVTVNES